MPNWGQGAQGAVGGAAVGTAILPGWGTAIGAGVGGLVGLFSGGGGPKYDEVLRARLLELEQEYAQRAAPQGESASAANSQFRTNQANLISQLEGMGRGEGPSAAAIQMRNANDQAVAGQNSLAAGGIQRGANAGAAMRGAANNAAGLTAQSNRDTGVIRAQEQLNAINQLGMTVHSARGADEATNKFNAGQQNQMTLANMEAIQRQYGLNSEAQLRALSQAGGAMYSPGGPGMGTQILAGGASALGGMMTARGAGLAQNGAAPAPAAQAPAALPTEWNFNPTPGYSPYGQQPVPSVTRMG